MTIGKPTDTDTIFVGTFRPPQSHVEDIRAQCRRLAANYRCNRCGGGSSCGSDPHLCWERGHMDQPIYASLTELIAAGFKPQVQ